MHHNMLLQVPQPQLHSCLCHSLDADSVSALKEIRSEGVCPSEMLHYVTVAPRIVPVCPARNRGQCDVQELNCCWAKPSRKQEPFCFYMSGTPSTAHTHKHAWATDAQMNTHMVTFKFSHCHCSKCPQNKQLHQI